MSNKPQDHKSKKSATAAKSWKKATKLAELDLPSGNTALVKPMRITTMLAEGFFPDSLRAIVMQQLSEEKPSEEATAGAIQEAFGDMNKLTEMFDVFDRICLAVVKEPQVLPAPENEADRDEDLLYIDEVDQEDKMFIFQWAVGGDRDIDTFRAESGLGVGSLEDLKKL